MLINNKQMNRRFCINPNEHFKYQLREYEPILRARQCDLEPLTSSSQGGLKRALKHDNE